MRFNLKVLLALLICSLVLGLGSPAPAPAQDSHTLTVFAAASLTDAFEEMAQGFNEQYAEVYGNVDFVFNFAGSSTLATQLSEGAPADVFASANNSQMNAARDAGRIGSTPRTFVKNRLVIAVPADNPANIRSFNDLAKEGIFLVLAVPGVPVRDYTDAMLERLVNVEGYGEAYRDAVMANLVSEEADVRQVAAKVAIGEADAGIVYRSDITPDIADEVIAIPIPDAYNTLATYPIATTNDPENAELAQAFVDFVLSDAGQDILVKWGFISSRIPTPPATVSRAEDDLVYFEGQILNPFAISADELRANYAAQTIEVTYLSGSESVTTTFTGVLLWDLLGNAQPNFNADVRNDKLSTYLVATGVDGYQAVIAWGEIDPEFGNQPVLVAFDENGAPLTDNGPLRLIVPGDARGGRYVSNLASISLRDAPVAD